MICVCAIDLLSHTRTTVRECCKGDEASQWKRSKFDPLPHQYHLTDFHKKMAGVIMSRMAVGTQNLVAIGLRFLLTKYVIMLCLSVTSFFVFVGSFNKSKALTFK